MIDFDDSGRPMVQVGGSATARLLLSAPARRYEDEPTLDFPVSAHGPWGNVETSVETCDGDGLNCRIETARFREEHFHVLREPGVQWA
ncbi:hypothetical protein GFH48_38625 [Streptomyces fagopyri]|uniref:Uncharacterized protein n=1 Tax=Streptomyces fagopyri TaxID=2662397 RepID=A0A5Q0LPG7_9ACTN|nr:hypothetical protein [Streptomyces fagopyri]QFZ78409.1 hypothetical protein GFH48_38625 [Streptomyces fagopyri]